MPSITTQATSANHGLPDDIFDLSHDHFYQFIEKQYGIDLAELFRFQSIRNGNHVLQASLDDILSILNEDSIHLAGLKKLCCFEVAGNMCTVKLGVKLAIRSLIQSLKIKQDQQRKRRRRATLQPPLLSIDADGSVFTHSNQAQNIASSIPSVMTPPMINPSSNKERAVRPQKSTELSHQIDIEQRINRWWCKTVHHEDLSLDLDKDYRLEINGSVDGVFSCYLTCSCSIRFKLLLLSSGIFKLSTFIDMSKRSTRWGFHQRWVFSINISLQQSFLSDTRPTRKKTIHSTINPQKRTDHSHPTLLLIR